jgi:undecaprenyl-diphosphatase
MVTGLWRGLNYEDAVRFAFLLSAPPILAAGLLKIPDLLGPLGNGIRGQVIAGSVAAFCTAFFSVHFLVRYFRTRGLVPSATYCVALGICGIVYFGIKWARRRGRSGRWPPPARTRGCRRAVRSPFGS